MGGGGGIIRRGIQPQGVQIPLLLRHARTLAGPQPRPPMVGGLVQPDHPHQISALPRVRGFGSTRQGTFFCSRAVLEVPVKGTLIFGD